MKFDRSVYKKKYFSKAIKEVEKDYHIQIGYSENDNYFEIEDDNVAIKVADYYIYIYNEVN